MVSSRFAVRVLGIPYAPTAVNDVMYVFGGYNEGNCHNDIYAFDLIRHHWTRIETSNGISPGTTERNCF